MVRCDALGEWIEGQVRAQELRESSAKAYRGRLAKWVYPTLGDIPINHVTREQLGAVIRKVREAGRGVSTVSHIHNALRGFFRHCVETKVLPTPSPAADLRWFVGRGAYRTKARAIPYFSQDEGRTLVEAARVLHPRWATFIQTGLLAGLRWGETAALYKSDIDWQRRRLHVQQTISAGAIRPPKNGRDRWVPIGEALLKALRSHLEAIDLDSQIGEWTPEQRQLVFPTATGVPVKYIHFLTEIWRPTLKKAGLAARKYHSTRHSYAAWSLSAKVDLRVVSEALGHASVKLTLDTYARHISVEQREQAGRLLDAWLDAK